MSSVTSREAAAMKLSRRNLLAGYKIPKVQPVASSLQARIGGYDVVVDESRSGKESRPRAINPEAEPASMATGINSGGDSSPPGTRCQTIAGAHFAGKQSRARAAKQRKLKAGRAPAKKLAKRIGPSMPKRPRRKGPATTSKQHAVQPSAAAAGVAELEPMYPFRLGAKERAWKSWESLHVAPKPVGQPAPPAAASQSCESPTPSSARVTDSAMAPALESPVTISPNEAEDASKSLPGSRRTPSSKRHQHPDAHSPCADKKRKQAVETSERKAETPRKAKIRKVESPTSPEQDKDDLFMADTIIEPKKDELTPLLRAPSLKLDVKSGAADDREEAKVKPSASLSPSDLLTSAKEHVDATLSMLIKEEEKCTPCTAYTESLQAGFQLYTAVLRKEGAQADSFTHLAAAHQQMLDAVRAIHQANHVTVKAE
ncbi:hypothetical protein C6P46_000373 [Rhodotorula mucilaginosa]|jgi:hypothetical protein|uniref:Uncharacterized protein n=1 Tax=Rhodotorula mucilaginosa TaxID=5537 RepID=A0A9P6VUP4_RHOMI|nr:hypothetical protein C6P46_000373 [Rhodotorula mucilaginosa]TKA50300.1 hypothetical protein B0A53_06289 [Rhodotorula sp. CCFEE 5036]